MSLQNDKAREQYNITSENQEFAIPFYFLDDSHIKAIDTDSLGAETTLVLNSEYTLTGAGNQDGGTITLIGGTTGNKLTVKRSVTRTQLIDYIYNDNFPAETHEKGLDKLTMLVQELFDELQGVFRVGETEAIDTIIDLASRGNSVFSFDTAGNPDFSIQLDQLVSLINMNISDTAEGITDYGLTSDPVGETLDYGAA